MAETKDLAPEFVEELFRRFDTDALTEEDRPIVRAMMEGYALLGHAVKEKNGKIHKLLKMTFGAKTEKAHTVLNTPSQPKGQPPGSRQERRFIIYGRHEGDRLPHVESRRPVSQV